MSETNENDYLNLDDEKLLSQCEVDTYKASGPGGQHRNKVSSAIRLRHRPTAIQAQGEESRSQHSNRKMAIRRLRMKIACNLRRPIDKEEEIPKVVAECIFLPRGKDAGTKSKLKVGRRDRRFWVVAGFVLDVLDALEGRMSDSAKFLGISTSNLAKFLQIHRHLLTAAQEIRKRYGQRKLEVRN